MKYRFLKTLFVVWPLCCLGACGDVIRIYEHDSHEDSTSDDMTSDGQSSDQSSDQVSDPPPTSTDCAEASTFVATHGQLKVEGRDLKDSCGNFVRLKGVSSMWLNWERDGYATNKTAMKWMIDNWDIKVIRAAMGTEPQGAYLSSESAATNLKGQVSTIVQNAIDLGIYVIIDWHAHSASDANQKSEAIAFFKEMAKKYGTYPNVLYEVWNEPLEVDWASVVKPYHEDLVAAIRAEDPDNIIILGTPQWDQLVNVATTDPVDGDNLMYTVHFYSCTHGSDLISLASGAYSAGVPIFVTEWGATSSDGGYDMVVCEDEADQWMDFLDRAYISWSAWKLDDCDDQLDSSCLLKRGAPVDGGWAGYLNGHASYVVKKLLEE
jgi:endoglucanase